MLPDSSKPVSDKTRTVQFFENKYGESLDEQSLTPTQLLENMNLMIATNTSTECQLNYAGVLLFAKRPQIKLPVFLTEVTHR